jgi:Ca-activated chloride channel family protein
MSARRRTPRPLPPPLPEFVERRPFQIWLERAVPFLLVAAVLLPVAAYAVHYIDESGGALAFSLPKGEWALGVRKFLLWGVLPAVALLLALWVGLWRRKKQNATLRFSRVADVKAMMAGVRARLASLPQVLRVAALACFLFALLGPQLEKRRVIDETARGIDIMTVLDVSGSMSADDLSPNRLEAAKRVIDEFIRRRENDRIGLVLFAKEAYWWCPLTLDHDALRTMLAGVHLGVINPRGTAIGDAIGTALNRLRRSKTKTKVIILLTDGKNNSGILMPRKAAEYARTLNVKVYTVLMGYEGKTRRGRFGFFRRRYPVDPRLLEEIAATTGGTPYLAGDTAALRNRFQKILDSLEKDKLPARMETSKTPIHQMFINFGLVFLVLELFLSLTVMRKFP